MNTLKRIFRFLFKPFHLLDKRLYPETYSEIPQLSEKIDALQKNNETLSENVRNINAMLNDYDKVILNLRNLNSETARLTTDNDRLRFMVSRIRKSDTNLSSTPSDASNVKPSINTDNYSVIDYFDFENYFRGSRELIKARQLEYLSYLKSCKKVVDIGCGRGEFLEIMQENNIPAVGVDTYKPFADYCLEKGFSAVCMDGIEYLSNEQGFDGIFAGQVIEHLTIGQIVSLIDTAYNKLPDGGVLIMETPNPRSLSIYVNAFFIDPSHVKPVHPETIRYLLKNAGFKTVDILYTKNSRPNITIPPIKDEDEFNSAMNKVQEMLFESQDYAAIARK